MYVRIIAHAHRVENGKNSKEKKNRKIEMRENLEKENKNIGRKLENGLLLVVPARIYGKQVKALIDSWATRCFVTLTCVIAVGLKGISREIFLILGNGKKYLSKGYVPDVPVVTVGLTVKIGFKVTNLQHEVDLVLGINWLQLVNPIVDLGGCTFGRTQCNPHRLTIG